MTPRTEIKAPTSDQIDAIIREAHKLRAEAFARFLAKIGSGLKGSVYPKGPRRPAAAKPA
ncbi:RSP_7527 family protein [Sulfitobacter aestuarii]|uniref:RSP_7527 family protein n=1 Tax=Sulfitobacter aestuarii TaxID=2161676 RepID=A0ABW5U460_9RHOB